MHLCEFMYCVTYSCAEQFAGHHAAPLPVVFLRLPPSQARPLLCVLPLRISAELHTQLALHIPLINQLPGLVCPRCCRPLFVVLLLRPNHTRSTTQSQPSLPWSSSAARRTQLWRHRYILRHLRMARTTIPFP